MSDSALTLVDDSNYPEFLLAEAAVVAFGMISCVPCGEYDPILQTVSAQYAGTIRFGKVRMHVPGVCREIKKKFSFEVFPTTHFYKRGVLVHSREGKIEAEELVRSIQIHLQEAPSL